MALINAQRAIQAKQERLGAFQLEIERIKREAQALGEFPFLRNVVVRPDLHLEPTLVLLEHPIYNAIYRAYQNLAERLNFSDYEMIAALLEQVPVARTSTLYEYWVFVQVYEELRSLGLSEAASSKGIWEVLDRRTLQYRPERYIEMMGIDHLYTRRGVKLHVRIYPQRRLADGQFCPDILIEFQMDSTRVLVLDAKYRDDYNDASCPSFAADVEEVAWHKYKRLEKRQNGIWQPTPDLDDLRRQIHASFIIHPQEGDEFIDYGSAGHANQYGGIPLIPEPGRYYSVPLRRLFTMFMRMHLNLLDICWSMDHPLPVKAQRTKVYEGDYRLSGEGEYYCNVCENYWWVNHCGHRNHALVRKIAFSAVEDNFFRPDLEHLHPTTGQPLLRCATCNRAYWR